MRTLIVITACAALVGCFPTTAPNGALLCGDNPARPCPAGYHCAGDNTCWHNGQDPEVGDGGTGVECTNQPKLTVMLAGDGMGTVTGPQISCPSSCAACFDSGSSAVLSAQADASSEFAGWSGDCSGSADCALTLDQDRVVTATFTMKQVQLTITNVGLQSATGTVTTDVGTNCTTANGTCTISAPLGTVVHLGVMPDARYGFQGWSGACASSGTQPTCSLTLTAPSAVTAAFSPLNYVFITSSPVASLNLGATPDAALAAADAFCNQKASGKLPGTYVAWLSTTAAGATAGVDAVKRLIIGGDSSKPARGWIRPDGRPFADSTTALTKNNQVFYPITIDETGKDAGYQTVATGTKSDGTAAGGCLNWSSTASTDQFFFGTDDYSGNGFWTGIGALACNTSARLYCFEVDYNSAVIITPPAQRRIAFFSKDPFADASAGLAAADQQCAAEAAAAGLSGSFKALLATTGASAASRFDLTGAPWARSDGVVLDLTAADFFANTTHLTGLSVAADGKTYCFATSPTELNGCLAWVGGPTSLTMPGTDADTCKNWSYNQTSTTYEARFGDSTTRSSGLLDLGLAAECNHTNRHLYCLQQ